MIRIFYFRLSRGNDGLVAASTRFSLMSKTIEKNNLLAQQYD